MFASNSDSAEPLVPAPDPAAMPGGSATPARRFVVGIGASAGGLEALSALLPHLPCDLGLTYVVVQHLSPTYRSMLAQLLGRETSMTVKDIEDDGEPAPNTVYITPANRNLLVQDGRFRLIEPAKEALPKPSINRFFASLAAQMNDSAIGIILSGTGSDGASGIHAIKAAGGFTFAQEPATAKYNGMPQAAIDTGSVDWILPPERIGQEITLIARTQGAVPLEQKPEAEPATLKKLLAKVRQHTRIDFSGYKEATLWRRIGRRMATNHVVDLDEYLQLIAERPEELEKLAKDILISVTAFFRDKEAFASLSTVVGRIVADKQPGEEIRVWVPGCATGEEAYSIAILFAEHLGSQIDQYRVQIFATDLDLDAMAMARRALFPASSLADLDPRQIRKYFVAHGDRYELAKPLRELVIFARQDLAQDPPFLRLDLISCRNVLIYFRSELQVRILAVFQYGLRPGGYLFLGRSESVFHQEALFEVVDKEARLYRRRRGTQKLLFQTEPRFSPPAEPRKASDRPPKDLPELLREQAVRLFLPVSLLVDEQLRIKHIHGDASRYLIIPSGKPSFDLLNLIRPELRTDLQTLIFQSGREQTSTQGRPRPLKGEPSVNLPVRMSVHPLLEENSEKLFLICFEPVPAPPPARGRKSGPADDHTHKELEDELAATREHLQTLVEELETSNEEMQALNEEVQASNEELQASNEELQASNEELQSTNEELTTLNEELQVKTSELEEANAELRNIQNSLDFPLIAVDHRLHLTRFNPEAARLFRLNATAVGTSLREITWPADVPDFSRTISEVLRCRQGTVRELVGDSRHYVLRVSPHLGGDAESSGAIITLLDNTDLVEAQRRLRADQNKLLAVMNNSVAIFTIKDAVGRYEFVNIQFERVFDLRAERVLGKTDYQLFPQGIAELFRNKELEVMRRRGALQSEDQMVLAGSQRSLLAIRFPLLSEDGTVIAVCTQALDITERKRIEEQLRLAARMFDHTAEAVMVTDRELRIVSVNGAFRAITGYSREEAVGQTPHLLQSGRHDAAFYQALWSHLQAHGWWQGEVWDRRKDGEEYLCWLNINAIEDAEGGVLNYVATLSDITLIRESHQRMEFLATHDELTGLPNRSLYVDRLRHTLARLERSDRLLAVLFIDLDNFKTVNDTLGHHCGDQLLIEAAERLKSCIRVADTVARLGGDEFTFLLEDIEKHEAALAASRVLEAFAKPFRLAERDVFVGCSIGIAVYPDDGSDTHTLLRNADTAMYRAKETGKNAFQFFTSNMAGAASQRLALESGLRLALEKDELFLHYQPQIDARSRRVVGIEALLRWRRADGSYVTPGEFIPVAEQSTLIVTLSQWVIDQLCRQILIWDHIKLPPVRVSFNVAARHFRHAQILATLNECIGRYAIDPARLCLELTEDALLDDAAHARTILEEIKRIGLSISIDDFGSGYSSLACLRSYPIDELKIDQRFVADITHREESRDIAATVAAIGNTLGLRVVAEGVETAEQMALLSEQGCRIMQGYHIANPMSASALADWIRYRLEDLE
jgi:two-component system, chemotaxis family, CheB/CheR fusion protein